MICTEVTFFFHRRVHDPSLPKKQERMHESRSPHRIMGKLLSVAARQGKINRIMESLTSRETIQILRSHKIIEITEIIKITKCVYRPRHLQLEDDAPARRLTPLNAPWDPGSVLFRASSSQTIIQPPDFFPGDAVTHLAGRKLGFGTLDPPVSKS